MKIQTVNNITKEQWVEQAQRFGKITDTNVNKLTFPKTGVTNLQAIIEINIVQPLSQGFKARVKYIQQFEELITTTDNEGNEKQTPVTRSHVVVDYYETIDRPTVNAMMAQLLPNAPTELTDYLDIQDWAISQGFLNTVVTKNTFGNLGYDGFEFI